MSDDEFLRRNISISSDRELDNLHLIPSLESSHTSRYMDFQNQKPGLSDPPHRGFHRSQDDSLGSTRRTWTEESELRNHGGSEEELTPVKKLRYKDSAELVEIGTEKPPSGQTREYSDLHLESNLRTPRYGTYTSYSEMIDSVHEQDPFHGDYKPSGKTKKSKSKKHKREKDKSQEEDLSVKDPLSKSSRKQSKKGRKSEVTGSTGTYTIQGLTNKSFTDSGPVADTSSVKSNGTYTLKQEDSVDGFRLSKKSSVGFSRKRKTRRSTVKLGASRINQRSFRDFIMRNRIMIRVPLPVEEIETTLRREHAHLLRQTKHVWHYQTHTKPEPTDSFGYINFQGYGNEIEASPYLRCEPDTKPEIIWDMMINQWHLEPPQLIISVTGGAQRFDLKRRMQETFKRGLMNAATSTCAWIITGGTRTGVMEFVGDAVKDHIITTGRKNDVVVLGIATWGCVANRHALDGEEGLKNGLFPAVYSKADVMEARLLNPKNVPLDENHSHFLLIDDGSENKFGAEIDFRTKLEKYISEQQVDPDDKESSLTIPVISIIVEGGINSMKTVWQAVTRGIPVLVLQSSGRAADYIAHGYNITAHKLSEEKSYFPKDFDEEMENLANRVFEWKEKDTPRKPALIANCLKQLREALQHREMLTVFDLNDYETKDFDRAILYALLKANRSNTNAQLSLALAWNRSDIAKNEIFTASNKTNYQELKLDDAMMTALIQDRLEFVKLFLENGIDLSHFLDIRNLWNLYSNCFNDKTDGAAQLLMNRINYLRGVVKQTWAAYLCCKQTEDIGVEPDLLNYIGKVIVHLLGDEAMNLYAGNQYDVHSEEVVFGYIPKAEKPCEEYLSVKKNLSKKKSRLFPEVEFKNPAKDLFIWAVLMNRMSLAKLFWKIGKDHIGSALFASCLLKELAKVADDEEEVELSVSLEQNSMEFEKLASEILGICSIQNRDLAHQLLVRELNEFGNTTLFCLADENVLMDFMGQTCCQTKLNAIWKGRMALYTSSIKIVASICLPFLIPAIKFVDKKRMVHEDEYDDLAPLHPTTQEMITEQDAPPSNREGPEGITGAGGKVAPVPESKTKILKRKFKTVTLFGGSKEGGEDINLFRAIYYFYTAPVTKFTTAMFANILFLGLFSLFVLTDLYPIGENDAPSIPEYLTWMYTVTSVIEELRQILTRDQRSLLYKIRSWYGSVWNRFDFIMYLTFLTSVILRFSLSGEDFMWARMLYSLTLAMYFIRFMHYFYAEKNIGPKVIMISRMLTDLMFFLLILLVFILSFGVAYHANLYPNSPKEWVLLKDVVYHPYWQMYGELFLENKEGNDPSADAGTCTSNETIWRTGEVDRCPEKNALVVLLMVVYMLLTNILLVNLLIAMFSDTFQKVQDNSEKVWRYHRYSLVYEFYERPALFPPLIILNHLFRAIRWLINRCSSRCCKNEIRTRNSFKLKLSEKDLIRLSLFERGAMEEHQHSVFSLENDKIDKKIETTSERLDRVIEELDNIKDNVMAKEKMMGGEVPITARSTSMSNVEPEVYSARKTHSQLEVEVDQLSNFVRENMHDLNASIRRLEKLILASTKQKQQTLDISHFQTSES